MSPLSGATCPSDEELALFLEGHLDPTEEARIRLHVDACGRCRVLLSDAVGAASTRVGNIFAGKYRIDGVLGSGGMGRVLSAFHVDLNRAVAIKLMHAELADDPDAARRFIGEARAAAALRSPNAIRVLDVDRVSETGPPYIVMEHLDGENLGTVLSRQAPLAEARVVDWMLTVLEVIGEAHALGMIHRDLKPENLFLTRDGVVKVLDFGLAKGPPLAGLESTRGTASKVIVGSPYYMSPEQIRSSRRVDLRTDIWAIGATIHHLLAGTPPFVAPNLLLLCSRILNEEPTPLRSVRPDVSPALERVVTSCLRKPLDLRPATVAILAERLRAARAEPNAASATLELPTQRTPRRGPSYADATVTTPIAPSRNDGDTERSKPPEVGRRK